MCILPVKTHGSNYQVYQEAIEDNNKKQKTRSWVVSRKRLEVGVTMLLCRNHLSLHSVAITSEMCL